MTVRRLLVAAIVGIGVLVGFVPTAEADPGACAWVDPYGVCISNPLPDLPNLPRVPRLP